MESIISLMWQRIGDIINLSGILIAAWLIVWQMGRQHRNSLALQKSNMRAQLRLEIYKELAEKIEICNSAITTAIGKLTYIPIKFSTQHMMKSMFQKEPTPIEETSKSFSSLHFNANEAIISLLVTMEKYEIAIPNFTVFKRHFSNQLDLIIKAFSEFHNEVIPFLPMDVPEDKVCKLRAKTIIPNPPDNQKIDRLKTLADKYRNECISFLAYLHDLRIEAQNNLLGSLFDYKLAPRKPEDPNMVVIRTENKKKRVFIDAFFNNAKNKE